MPNTTEPLPGNSILRTVCLILLFAALSLPLKAQTYEWAWMGGSALSGYSGQPGIYGTLGTAVPGNAPGSRRGAASWTDSKGNLWAFGGEGYDSTGSPAGFLNDLWKYDPVLHEWTWIAGSETLPSTAGMRTGPIGVYGNQGSPDPNNVPGARAWAVGWTDANGKLWLFGGQGFDANGSNGTLNDLWEFNPTTSEWTWMGGSKTIPTSTCISGVYGTLGVPSAQNIPSPRSQAAGWTDASGNLWMFGGSGYDPNCNQGTLNDMWMYSPSAGTWTWTGGSNSISKALMGTPGIYGSRGVFATGNTPGSRNWAAGWTDKSGNLWLFGGLGFGSNGSSYPQQGYLNDLWEFKPSLNEWAWISGSSNSGSSQPGVTGGGALPGIYGSLQTASASSVPGGRYASTGWSDSSGDLWIFGGKGLDSANTLGFLNDLWRYSPSTQQWTWMGGSASVPTTCKYDQEQGVYGYCGLTGNYGSLATPTFGNFPGGRDMAAAWIDSKGNFWLMGGEGYDSTE
ncbi:MAG: kelch repeat-containing protein [Acidobacteriota bacterium]